MRRSAEELERLRVENALRHRQLCRLRHQVASYRRLADTLGRAAFWDCAVYGPPPDGRWVAVEAAEFSQIMERLGETPRRSPWRLGLPSTSYIPEAESF